VLLPGPRSASYRHSRAFLRKRNASVRIRKGHLRGPNLPEELPWVLGQPESLEQVLVGLSSPAAQLYQVLAARLIAFEGGPVLADLAAGRRSLLVGVMGSSRSRFRSDS
jgi:hypothetical protein